MPDFTITPRAGQRMVAASVSPKMSYDADGARTNQQATDHTTGAPLWRVAVFVMDEDSTRTPAQISVTVPAQTAPALPQLQPVTFTGLRVLIWAGGASLRADSVEPVISPTDTSAFLSDIDVAGGE